MHAGFLGALDGTHHTHAHAKLSSEEIGAMAGSLYQEHRALAEFWMLARGPLGRSSKHQILKALASADQWILLLPGRERGAELEVGLALVVGKQASVARELNLQAESPEGWDNLLKDYCSQLSGTVYHRDHSLLLEPSQATVKLFVHVLVVNKDMYVAEAQWYPVHQRCYHI